MSTLETFSSAFTSCVSRVRLVVILVSVLLVPHFSQSGQDAELPELVAKRKVVTRAIERASVPALSDYAKKLSPLKEQFARNRQLEAALCVERELKKVGDAITAANSTGERRSKTSDGPQLSDPPELTAKRMEHLRAVA